MYLYRPAFDAVLNSAKAFAFRTDPISSDGSIAASKIAEPGAQPKFARGQP